MVVDNKNKPAFDSSKEVSSAIVGGDSEIPSGFIGKIKRNKLKMSLVLLAILLLASWLHFGLHVGEKVYAQAAGHKIYKNDIDHIINGKHNISQHDAAQVLADKYLTEAMAKKADFKITKEDTQAALNPDSDQQKKANPYVYQLRVNQFYFTKLRNNNNGIYKGQLLVAQFSRYVAYQSPLLAERQAVNPNIGNPTAVAADKLYAQNFIIDLYDQIKSGKISFNQAIQTEYNDPQVGEKAYPTLSHSGSFDTSSSFINRNNLLEASSIRKQVRAIKSGQISKPFAVQVSNSESGASTAESYYLVVKMDSVSGQPSGLSFDDYLTLSKKEFGYRIYV